MHFSQVEESLESNQGHLKIWAVHFTQSHFMKLQLMEDLGGPKECLLYLRIKPCLSSQWNFVQGFVWGFIWISFQHLKLLGKTSCWQLIKKKPHTRPHTKVHWLERWWFRQDSEIVNVNVVPPSCNSQNPLFCTDLKLSLV